MLSQFFKSVRKISTKSLALLGITKPNLIYNLSHEELHAHEIQNNEGELIHTKYGQVFGVHTGKYTGRSPKDKWVVKEENSNIWWGNVNKPITSEIFQDLADQGVAHINSLDHCYVYDGYCGANPQSRKRVRFIHELAWQQHFVKNMFIDRDPDDTDFEPDFTILNACSVVNQNWQTHGLNSEVAIAFDISKKLGVILGTWYGGENKKGIFGLMNYWLPQENILSMHCSANVGAKGDTALFFGLSGTGKTTLSADPQRYLIGDDEHGWDDSGIFNFEEGCYAKTINLKEENEPEIYRAIRQGALLENIKTNNGVPDYDDTTITENGRVSYPIYHIDNWHQPQMAQHPKNIIFLTCDAFGVLPPVAKLSIDQAMYHFLSGYTAKVAGTERGITEPQATFSACFGEAFLTLHPTVYAELLAKKLRHHNCNVYLVNTGWTGGGHGVGKRMEISHTRECISQILSGGITSSDFEIDPTFNFAVPRNISYIGPEVCIPRNSWASPEEYDIQAQKLAKMFTNNYEKYRDDDFPDYSKHGPIKV